MNKRGVLGFVAALAVIFAVFWMIRSATNSDDKAAHGAEQVPSHENVKLKRFSGARQTRSSTEERTLLPKESQVETVDLERTKWDEEYRKTVSHHTHIKTYLNSPMRGTSEYESILTVLLQNGYSLDALYNTYIAVNSSAARPVQKIRQQLSTTQLTNVHGAPISNEAVSARLENFVLEHLSGVTGIADRTTLEQLANIGRTIVPAKVHHHPRSFAEQGEPFLTDFDWMTDDHKRAAASYIGEPRTVISLAERGANPSNQQMSPRLSQGEFRKRPEVTGDTR